MTTSTPLSPPLLAAIASIQSPQPETEARAHLDTLTKPRGSLGRLEDLAAQLHSLGIIDFQRAAFVFAADHGLAAEGISAYPSEVTQQMVLNFLAGGAAINILARLHHADVFIVDAGVAGSLPDHPKLTKGGFRAGSRNMLHEAAMSGDELKEAFALGLRCAENARAYNLIAVGEMGIGNTASASLLTSALTGHPIEEVTGRGTGLDDKGYDRKVAVLTAVLAVHREKLTSSSEILRHLGGLEIAAMAGFMIGAASNGAALLIDGFISTAAAAFALAFAPAIRPYLFASHRSQEPGHGLLLAHLGLIPLLDLGMRLGEGTGAVLAMSILEAASALYSQMATFTSAGVSVANA